RRLGRAVVDRGSGLGRQDPHSVSRLCPPTRASTKDSPRSLRSVQAAESVRLEGSAAAAQPARKVPKGPAALVPVSADHRALAPSRAVASSAAWGFVSGVPSL